jgi:hypothetical protein
MHPSRNVATGQFPPASPSPDASTRTSRRKEEQEPETSRNRRRLSRDTGQGEENAGKASSRLGVGRCHMQSQLEAATCNLKMQMVTRLRCKAVSVT